MSPEIVAELAPTGVLRAGINLSNFLLVTGKSAAGEPEGVAPDLARELARRLDVPLKLVPFKSPGELADAAGGGAWDIGLIGAEPQRAEAIAFTAAYVEIEATYLVPAGSALRTIADVDAAGVRIAVTGRSAYGLWLDRNIKHAELVRTETIAAAFERFVHEKLDALAGLRPGLLSDLDKLPGARILDGRFTSVQQAIGTAKRNAAGAAFLRDFVEEAKASGLVARLIERHKVRGLSVAAPARGDEISLVAPGGIRAALQQLIPLFESRSGHKVTPTFTSGGAAKAKAVDGELFDVPIVQPPLDSVIASGHVLAASETALATVRVIVAVRSGIPKPDLSSGEAVRRMLLAAQSVACPSAARGAACGVSFDATLARLGIAEAMAPKIKPAPGGWGAIEMLARGEVEVGITFASENDPDPRVEVLGPLPRDISEPTGFVAFVHARSKVPDAAAALIEFLKSADAAKIFEQSGMVPAGIAPAAGR